MTDKDSSCRTKLRNTLVEAFNDEEIRTLCMDLDVDYDDLAGQGITAKARELIAYLERLDRIPDLVSKIKEKRPKISWECKDPPDGSPPPAPAQRDWSRLKPYLPVDAYQKLMDEIPDKREEICKKRHMDHLLQLLRTVTTYLPRHLALELLQKPTVAEKKGRFLDGTVLFADIAGFTKLSEELSEAGSEGTERLVSTINQFLDVMLGILYKHGGQLINFSGDGMLCLFSGGHQGAMQAAMAAWEMKQARLPPDERPFKIKAGICSGRLFAGSLGTQERSEYVLTGMPVERAAQAESAAPDGEVFICRDTYDLIKDSLEAEEFAEETELYRVGGICSGVVPIVESAREKIEELLVDIKSDLWKLVDRLDNLTSYLPAGILPQLIYYLDQDQIEGQHRQVTVLFINCTGVSNAIQVRRYDEADITSDLREYFQAMQEEIEYFGGAINKVDLHEHGFQLMVTFGAPRAYEKDAHRATLTAIKLRDAKHRLTFGTARLLSQRVGINTGLVFAGNVGSVNCDRREYTVIGDSVNLAARLMSHADPDEILVSHSSRELVGEACLADALDPLQVHGKSDRIPVHQLRGVSMSQQHRIPRAIQTKMVGREAEFEKLKARFRDLRTRKRKQIIAVTGDIGIGKTRLVMEWQQWANAEAGNAVAWLEGRGHAYGQKAKGVFIEIVEQLLDFADGDTQEQRWDKLSKRIEDFGWLDQYLEIMAYLGHFLGLDLSLQQGSADLLGQDADNRNLKIRRAVCDLIERATERGGQKIPLVLVLEDLHWADASSLDLLQFLWDRIKPTTPVLFCLIYRSLEEPPIREIWQKIGRRDRGIKLRELTDEQSRELLVGLLDSSSLSQDFSDLVLQVTAGNPLYIEEVLRALIEDGTLVQDGAQWQIVGDVEKIHVPGTLRQIIQSRIDELDFASPGARRVLWMAAVIGKEFAEEPLLHLFTSTGRTEDECVEHLEALTRRADMIREIESNDKDHVRCVYQFRHDFIHQVAYENMSVAIRRKYHSEVGRWLEREHSGQLEQHYHTLAYHYDQGWQWDKAFQYRWLAGQRGAQAFDNHNSISHFERALEISGFGAQDAQALGPVHFELGKVLETVGEFDKALHHQARAYGLFALQGARACYHVGRVYEQKGGEENWAAALEWQRKGLALLPDRPTAEAALLHALAGLVKLRQRELEQALVEAGAALTLAQETGTKPELGNIYRLLSMILRAQKLPDKAMEYIEWAIEIDTELSDLRGLSKDYLNQGVIALDLGNWKQAVDADLGAIATFEQIGDKYNLAVINCNLADKYRRLGCLENGFDHAKRGLDLFTQMGSIGGKVFARAVLGPLYWRQGDLEQAKVELLEARKLMEPSAEFGPAVGRWLAQVYLTEGNVEGAESEITALLPKEERPGVDAEPVQRLWGQILAAQGDLDKAIRVLRASLDRLDPDQDPYNTACTSLALAWILAEMEDSTEEAKTHAERARKIFDRLGAKLDLQEAQELMAKLEESGGIADE